MWKDCQKHFPTFHDWEYQEGNRRQAVHPVLPGTPVEFRRSPGNRAFFLLHVHRRPLKYRLIRPLRPFQEFPVKYHSIRFLSPQGSCQGYLGRFLLRTVWRLLFRSRRIRFFPGSRRNVGGFRDIGCFFFDRIRFSFAGIFIRQPHFFLSGSQGMSPVMSAGCRGLSVCQPVLDVPDKSAKFMVYPPFFFAALTGFPFLSE